MGRLFSGLGGCLNGFFDGGCEDEGFINIIIVIIVLFIIFSCCNSKCR